MGRNLRWSIVAASRPQWRWPFKMTTAKLRLAQASQSVRGGKIKIAASRKLTSSPARAVKELLND
jgi:hypothetical protein